MDSTTAAQQFREAEQRFSARRFPEALDLLENLSLKTPLHEAVEFARAQTLAMMGRASEAEAVCDNLLPLFGAEGVGELKKVLADLQQSGDEEIRWGFLRPTEDPVSFDSLDATPPEPPSQTVTNDVDSFFAELDDSALQGLDDIEVVAAPASEPADTADAAPVAESETPQGERGELESTMGGDEVLSAFDTGTEVPESDPPLETPAHASAFDDEVNPLGALGSFGDDFSFDEPTEPEPPQPPNEAGAAEEEVESLGALQDEAPDAEPPTAPQNDFEDLGELGELGALDEAVDAEPAWETVNLPPADDQSSDDFKLGGLSDFGSDESGPGAVVERPAAQKEAPEPSIWGDSADEDSGAAPPLFDPAAAGDAFQPAVPDIDGDTPRASIFDEPAPAPAPSPSRVAPPPETKRSRAGVTVLLLVLLAAAGGGGAWYYFQGQTSGTSTPAVTPAATGTEPGPAAPPARPAAPALTDEQFAEMLAKLEPNGDPQPIMDALAPLGNLGGWPEPNHSALAAVVEASGHHVGTAVSNAYTELAHFMIDHGAEAGGTDRRGQALVDLAAQTNDEPMVRLLVGQGAAVTPKLFVWAVRSGRLPLVQEFLETHPDAATPEVLYAAIDTRHEAIADVLITHGVPLDAVAGLAVQRGTRHVFRYALEGGVNLNAHPELLRLAIQAQQPTMVELLLQSGVDPRAADETGQSALATLEARSPKTPEEQEMLRLIQEQMAVRPAAPTTASSMEPAAEAPIVSYGTLYARAKQQESAWSAIGPWRGGLPPSKDQVYRIAVEADQPEALAPLTELRPGDLYALTLEGPGVTDASLASVANLSGLRELELIGARISDAGLQRLAHLTLLTSLRIVSPPAAPRAQINGPGLTILRPMLHLTHLDVSGTTFGDRALPLLDGLAGLETLNIAGTEVTDSSLGSLRHLRNLTVLAFGTGPGLASKITGSALYAVRDLENLRELYLYGVPMSQIGFEALGSLRRLSYLDLRATGLTAQDVPELSKLKHVGTIILAENDLDQQSRTTLQKQLSGSTLKF